MTAELSDIFPSKDIGVRNVVEIVEDVFSDAIERFYVAYDLRLIRAEEVYTNTIAVAAANWAASAWLLEKISVDHGIENALFVDIGSTTTTIIPLIHGKAVVRARTDPDKLVYGELVYLGTLRTDVSSIVSRVPYKGLYAGVCRERFALMGDVQLILGYIDSASYTTETADGRGKSVEEAMARLSRVVCADMSMVNPIEVKEIARYIHESAVFKVFEAIV